MNGMDENSATRFVREVLGINERISVRLDIIPRGGSDRAFYRCTMGELKVILMQYGLERAENALYADIGRFLKDIGIRVPDIIAHDSDRHLILMEYLGEKDLWSARNEPWMTRNALYRDTLSMAAKLHTFPLKNFPNGIGRLQPVFGPELYLCERCYFREQFVRGVCGLSMEVTYAVALEEELDALARRLIGTGLCLVHRDLQSQNVMVCDEKTFWIDFQGMRLGSLFYDLASLLYDPYVSFAEEERLELLRYYASLVPLGLEWTNIELRFREAAVQRLMQALGAYGFLGMKKGKTSFLSHIPRGMDHLTQAAAQNPNLPHLMDLLEKCRHKLPASFTSFPDD
jgi:aminoglycoside/choline kinase family phosphotransferase